MKPPACLLCSLCLAVAMVTVAGSSSREVEDCDIRFEDNGACACSSHDPDGPVSCYDTDKTILIQQCYCMYYNPTQNLSIVGHCYYSCYEFYGTVKRITSSIEYNDNICSNYGNLNRVGRFCGQCNETYGLAAYSYQVFSCIPCQDYGYMNWLRYFAVALLPLTVFYILAVLLSFNVTSSSLNGMVLVIQCILSPIQVTLVQGSLELNGHHATLSLLKAATSILCTVNLDFFRLVYPPFCLHPQANIFQILSLDYIVALYPFLLIFMTCMLVTAYDRRYRLVVWMWRPVQRCVYHHRNTWNIHTSLIEIFATFILFSYVKILGVSVQILAFTNTQDVQVGNKLNDYYPIFDGTVKYFGPGHLPYALLAIAISSVFVVLPFLLLAVYPSRCFHKCLNCCGLRYPVFHIFMDAFQGCYRTEPRDLRYFSAFYLLLRMLMLVQFQVFPATVMLFTSGIVSLAAAAVVAVFQPYKVKAHNTMDIVLMVLMGIYFLSYHAQLPASSIVPLAVQNFSIVLLLFYFVSWLAWKLLGGKLQAMVQKAKVMWSTIVCHTENDGGERLVEAFDREPNSSSPLLREKNPSYQSAW